MEWNGSERNGMKRNDGVAALSEANYGRTMLLLSLLEANYGRTMLLLSLLKAKMERIGAEGNDVVAVVVGSELTDCCCFVVGNCCCCCCCRKRTTELNDVVVTSLSEAN